MKQRWRVAIRLGLALALIATMAVVPAITPSSCMVGQAQGKPLRVDSTGEFAPHRGSPGVGAAKATPASSPGPTTTAVAPGAAVPREKPVSPPGDSDAKVPAARPVDPPAISALNPAYARPTNLAATYDPKSPGNHKINLTWTGITSDFIEYLVEEWTNADFASMVGYFNQLAVIVPSALTHAQNFQAHTTQAMQSGLTITQRQDIANLIVIDLDALFAIITANSGNPSVQTLWSQLLALATQNTANKKTDYQRIQVPVDNYYFYVVLASYTGGDTSPPSNSQGIFAFNDDAAAPAQPTGFTAIAYDPGVGLQWNANTEMYLAGYNVYVTGDTTPLNGTTLIQGTEYFHMTGAVGVTYYVEAVNNNVPPLASTRASAVSLLAPATYYYANDPGWFDVSGIWRLENYTSYGGYILRVAQDPPSRTRITFTGRRVRLFCATYCQSSDVRVWVDSVNQGTYSLYSLDPVWGVAVFTITGLSKGSHTFELECLGTGGVTIPDSNPPTVGTFVNVQYLEAR